MDTWCHNPRVTRTPDGTWLLYSIGHGVLFKEPYTGCSAGVTRKHDPRWREGPLQPDNHTIVLSSTSPSGPWTSHAIPTRTSAGIAAPHLDNPAPLPPHSLAQLAREAKTPPGADSLQWMVMFASRPKSSSAQLVRPHGHNSYGGCPHGECSQLGVARASVWNGGSSGYVMDPHPVCAAADPVCVRVREDR